MLIGVVRHASSKKNQFLPIQTSQSGGGSAKLGGRAASALLLELPG